MNALGPVIGNRFADERKTQLKPYLMHRLVEQTVRAVPMGTMVTGQDGRLAFVPNYTHVTEKATKVRPAEGDDERSAMEGFDPVTEPLCVGDYVEMVYAGVEESGWFGRVRMFDDIRGALLDYDNGKRDVQSGWGDRSSLKLIRKADPARKPS